MISMVDYQFKYINRNFWHSAKQSCVSGARLEKIPAVLKIVIFVLPVTKAGVEAWDHGYLKPS